MASSDLSAKTTMKLSKANSARQAIEGIASFTTPWPKALSSLESMRGLVVFGHRV
jgi:hypothetical protein